MLEFSSGKIQTEVLSSKFYDEWAGALVVFEGRVRNNHLGRDVLALEYEAAVTLANNEFAKIEKEIVSDLPILQILCVHRVGRLEVGEVAIWLGVLAPHRKEAFLGCERIMSDLKKRLPIWKKEFFTDGRVSWVDDPCGCVNDSHGPKV